MWRSVRSICATSPPWSGGYKEREAITRVDGRESVELAVYKEGDANTVQVASRIDRALERVRETLPDDHRADRDLRSVALHHVGGQRRQEARRFSAGIIAIIVLYGFLRDARATTIVGIAIPVSVIGTFLLMYMNGVSLNIMSLGGIALAVGMLVDNSIVVLENIVRKKEQGQGIIEAARNGTAEVAGAVFAATLTTIAVFFPMVFITGIAGQLFRDQALTVTFALIFSLIVALTLIPMLASLGAGARYRAENEDRPSGRLYARRRLRRSPVRLVFAGVRLVFWLLLWPATWLFQRLYGAAAHVYPGILRWSLRHRGAVVVPRRH